jgi:regulator of replication initiation timing
MTREEHTALIRKIQEKIKDIDDGSITEELAELSDDYGTTLGEIDTLNLKNTKLTNDNENLRDTNMRLFLKVGEKVMNDKSDNSEQSGTSDATPMPTIESLFDEKGELK